MTDEAIAWLIRINEPGFDDWEAYEAWVDRDPAHAALFHKVADADAELVDELRALRARRAAAPGPAIRPVARRRYRPAVVGATLASLGAVAAAVLLLLPHRLGPSVIEAGPGALRSVVLAGGDRVDLAGGTRIVIEHGAARHVRLERGKALFAVNHDAVHPFTVDLDGMSIRDVGTVFEVARGGDGSVDVAVAEGSVLVDPDGAARVLERGEQVHVDAGGRMTPVASVDPAAVGGWRGGQLHYGGAPLSQLVADLAHTSGEPVTLQPSLSQRRFTGTLVIGDRRTLVARAAAILALDAQHKDGGWYLSERTTATP